MSTVELLQAFNDEDARVAPAVLQVLQVLPALAAAVDRAVERIRAGGTVHYFGACASGLTASGRTPSAAEAPAAARARGALTVLITANPQAEPAGTVEHLFAMDTGPEVVTGSILREATGADELAARHALELASGELKPALPSLMAGVEPDMAGPALEHQHRVTLAERPALPTAAAPPRHPAPGHNCR